MSFRYNIYYDFSKKRHTKYREGKAVDFTLAKRNVLEVIDICIKSWSDKKSLPEALLTQRKSKVSECID